MLIECEDGKILQIGRSPRTVRHRIAATIQLRADALQNIPDCRVRETRYLRLLVPHLLLPLDPLGANRPQPQQGER